MPDRAPLVLGALPLVLVISRILPPAHRRIPPFAGRVLTWPLILLAIPDSTAAAAEKAALLLLIPTFSLKRMAGLGCCSALSSRSGFRADFDGKTSTSRRRTKPHHPARRLPVVRAEVGFVKADEAKKLVSEEGYVIVDVRDKTQHQRAHIKSSYHVPFFIENEDGDLGTIVKRTVHNNFSGLFFGIPFTKPNPAFVQGVKDKFEPDAKLLLVCQEGLRSAAAAEMLDREGYQNISCITSGLQSLKPGTFDSVGTFELQNAGKAGLVTVQGKISAVVGTILVCAFLFVTFFPDQAEKILNMAPPS